MHCLALFGIGFEQMRPWLQAGGYSLLFGFLFACGLGLPVPEDLPLTTAGFLIAQHHMHLAIAAPVAWFGIMCGDTALYTLGYRYGRNICKIPFIGKHVTVPRLQRAELLFQKWGIWVVAVGRLFAGIRGAMVVAAGTTRFKYIKFIIADGLAAIVSGGMFIALGIWFGSNVDLMERKAEEFKITLMISAAVLLVAILIYLRWRNRRHSTIGQVVVSEVEKIAVESTKSADGSH